MKSSLFSIVGLAFAFLPALGCGTVDSDYPPPAYPPTPVGYDGPEQQVAASSVDPGSPGSPLEARQDNDEEGRFAPARGDIQVGTDDATYADTDPAALTDFKPALEPYGTWADDATYGTVWTPSPTVVGSDFAPYVTAGHWAYDDDYVWVSDYNWGWAPFHYGRWVYIGGRGWGWIPGRTYAGAWVSWRYGMDDYGYLGWAPMPPTWYWRGGIALGIGYVPRSPYVFCGYHDVFSPVVGTRIVTGPRVGEVAGRTRPWVPASPSVGGHLPASPSVGGPPPSVMKLPPNEITRVAATTDRGVARAQQFARPNTAVALGARPPAHVAQANALASPSGNTYANRAQPGFSAPAYGPHVPVATSQQYRGVAPTPHPYAYGPAQSYPVAPGPRPTGVSPSYGAQRPLPSYSAPVPSYGAQRPTGVSPSYSAPRPSFPAQSSPAFSPRPSAPSFSAPSAPRMSAPSMPAFRPQVSAPMSRPSGASGFGHVNGGAARGRR